MSTLPSSSAKETTVRYEDFPTNDDFDEGGWQAVIQDGVSGHAYVEQDMTAVVTQEPKGVVTVDRIKAVHAFSASSSEGYASRDVVALLELEDGWATVMAWCDTTGWDCQAGATWKWAATREEAIMNGLGKDERRELGLSLPHEVDGGES